MELKYLKYLVALFIASCFAIVVCYMRYLSFSQYNVRPLKECDRYLKETYYGQFKGKIADFYGYDGYYVWKLKYIDENGMEFDMYYRHPAEIPGDGLYWFFASNGTVYDYYWQKKLREVYEKEFQIKQYETEWDLSVIKYSFKIVQDSDIENISNIITTTLIYTKENVKKISSKIIGYSVSYKDKTIYAIILDEETQKLLDKERDYIFQHIYSEIKDTLNKKKEV